MNKLLSPNRTVFFVSDRTGITAEVLGQSLLTQFHDFKFERIIIPFIDNLEKANDVSKRINQVFDQTGIRPIVFSTLVDSEISALVSNTNSLFLNCFQSFVVPLEEELGVKSSHTVGLSHSAEDPLQYHKRIEAINFTLAHDDGVGFEHLDSADIVLVGVSRCGKTPTCVYLSVHFGIRAANYPLTEEDLNDTRLPKLLEPCRTRLYGLSIRPERLSQIRSERRPGSSYARLEVCRNELHQAEEIMKREGISFLDTTTKSIEEIATTILYQANLERRIY